jgi:hypothetical protein
MVDVRKAGRKWEPQGLPRSEARVQATLQPWGKAHTAISSDSNADHRYRFGRGPISRHGPTYLRWALFEAALNACKHPYCQERYQQTKRRLGRQRGPKVAQIDHPKPALRSGRCPFSSSRLTAHFGHAPPDEHSDQARSQR